MNKQSKALSILQSITVTAAGLSFLFLYLFLVCLDSTGWKEETDKHIAMVALFSLTCLFSIITYILNRVVK